jgi:CheY-like chemotaxis protein
MTDPRRAQIVIVEDNNADIILFKEALQAAGIVFDLSRFTDGLDCIESLAASRDHQRPDLIIIDLNLPKSHGFEVLKAVRADSRFDGVPVAILTSSRTLKDQQASFELGANAFITKPIKLDDFLRTVGSSVQALLSLGGRTATLWMNFSQTSGLAQHSRKRLASEALARNAFRQRLDFSVDYRISLSHSTQAAPRFTARTLRIRTRSIP